MLRLITLLATLTAAACLSPASPDAVTGKPFELKAGAVATLPDGGRLKFEKVSGDSRCPMDANCVWAGDATVAISVSRSGSAAEARELHTQANGSQISYGNYVIKLTALAPYPKSSQQIRAEDYVATIVVNTP